VLRRPAGSAYTGLRDAERSSFTTSRRFLSENHMKSLEELAKALQVYVMNNRDGDAADLAMIIDRHVRNVVLDMKDCLRESHWVCDKCSTLRR
jgi:hypothetical protein